LMVIAAGGLTVAVGMWLAPVQTEPTDAPVTRIVGLVALVAALAVALVLRRFRQR
jgi:hypothetical protein